MTQDLPTVVCTLNYHLSYTERLFCYDFKQDIGN